MGDSAVELARALARNKSLRDLALAHNPLSDRGAQELGTSLARNGSLRTLDARWTGASLFRKSRGA